MEWYVIMGYVLFGCFFIGMIVFFTWLSLKNNKAIMDRAKKIDPTVKTLADAQYVLRKDIAQSVGTGKVNDKK